MRPSVEARLGIGLLLALQLATSLAGVALLGRMSPAVERILTENVYSTEAVEDMLAALVTDQPGRFSTALERARGNITEEAEVELLDAIAVEAEAALAGSPEARASVTRSLRALASVNRDSMVAADQSAARLGLAGAWAMALLGFLGFLGSLSVSHRVERRLLAPVVEVDAVLAAARDGDVHRRCAAAAEPDAGARLMDNLNWLLDRHLRSQPGGVEDAVLRAAVLALMRDRAARAVLLGAGEAVLGATEGALRALAGAGGPAGLASAVGRGEAPPGWRVRDLGADLRLVVGEDGPA